MVSFLVLVLLGLLRLLKMGLLSSFIACFSLSPTTMQLILSMHVKAALVCGKQRFPGGGRLPLLYGPLPATPGHFLSLAHHAGAVWTAAPWSAAVLAVHNLDDHRWLAELKWFALCHIPSNPFCVTSHGKLTGGVWVHQLEN